MPFSIAERAAALPRFARFVLVGVVNTATHYAVYLCLWLVVPYLAAHLIAVTAAMSCSYVLNCRFTFRVRPTWRKFLLYPASNAVNIAFSTAAVYVLVESLSVDSRIATILGGIAAIPATFVVSRSILVARTRGPVPDRRGRSVADIRSERATSSLTCVRESPE